MPATCCTRSAPLAPAAKVKVLFCGKLISLPMSAAAAPAGTPGTPAKPDCGSKLYVTVTSETGGSVRRTSMAPPKSVLLAGSAASTTELSVNPTALSSSSMVTTWVRAALSIIQPAGKDPDDAIVSSTVSSPSPSSSLMLASVIVPRDCPAGILMLDDRSE